MKRTVKGYDLQDKRRCRGSFSNEERERRGACRSKGVLSKGEELMWTVDRTRTRGGRHTGDE